MRQEGTYSFMGSEALERRLLQKTVGLASASNHSQFKQIGCSTDSTFPDLIRQIIEVFDPRRLAEVEKTNGWSFAKIFGFSRGRQETYGPSILTVSAAADILASLDNDGRNTIRVVLIDEIDRLGSDDTRRDFAELVKLLGDRGLG